MTSSGLPWSATTKSANCWKGHTEHWRLERMAAVDRNILRAGVAEFLGFPKTPRPVIINEALEIARRFSTPESVQFINGVLDSVARKLEPQPSVKHK